MCDLYPKLTFEAVDAVVKAIFSTMSDTLSKGGRIEIRSFGCFSTKVRRANVVRNPRNGSVIAKVGPKHLVYFRASKEFKENVNS
jgi:integration host factor subunit beta